MKSGYKWPLLLFLLWVYRVSCMPADDAGFAKGLQIFTTLGLLLFALKLKKDCILPALFHSKVPAVTMSWYLLLALASTLWSYTPALSFFMSFEKLTFMVALFAVLSQFRTFENAERMFVYLMTGILLFNGVIPRVMGHMAFIGHDLQQGSCAAICFSYCCGELLTHKTNSKHRYKMLKSAIIISIFFLAISTSGGANASAAFGFGVAMLFSGNLILGILISALGVSVFYFSDWFDSIFKFLMAGKSEEDIQSSTGRAYIWDIVKQFGAEKPVLGWGHAALERYITDNGPITLVDLHSNYYGAYGNTGFVGLVLLVIHHVTAIIYTFGKRLKPGYVGLLCAICCTTLNGYSYGFLVGKTAIITIAYFAVLVMAFVYSNVKYSR